MDATIQAWTATRRRQGAIGRLFDNRAFLAALCMLPTAGLLLIFLTYPLGLGVWLAFHQRHDRPAGPVHRAR